MRILTARRTPARRLGVHRRSFVPVLETLEERLPLATATMPAQTIAAVFAPSSSTAKQTEAVFAITPSKGLAYYDGTAWATIGGAGTIASLSAVMEVPRASVPPGTPVTADDPVVFAITAQGGLARYDVQEGGWEQIGGNGTISAISAGLDAKGLADVFVITANGSLTEWDAGSWLASPIGAAGTILNMSAGTSGGLDAVTADHSLFTYNSTSGWMRLSAAGFANSVSAVNGTDFVITPAGGLDEVSSTGTVAIGGAGTITSISAGTDTSNRPEVFAITNTGELAEYSVQNGWQTIGGANTVAQMSGTADGLVFVTTTDGSIDSHNASGSWTTLAGTGFGQT
jgi:hypothetical protein